MAKAKQTEEEMIYGSRPVTPAKRRFANGTTPSKTPKQRKVTGKLNYCNLLIMITKLQLIYTTCMRQERRILVIFSRSVTFAHM